MTEKDLLRKLLEVCELFEVWNISDSLGNEVNSSDTKKCIMYLTSKINGEIFNRQDKDQWQQAKDVMYDRLKKNSPQTMFELTLGLPDGVATVILDEITYGKMYMDSDYKIWYIKDKDS